MPMQFIVNQMENHVKSTRAVTSEYSRNMAIKMYEKGATWNEITKQTGLKPTSIQYHLKRRGIPLRTRK